MNTNEIRVNGDRLWASLMGFALMSADRVCQKLLRIKGSILLSPAQCEITVPCARIARGSQQCDLPRTIDAANETGLMALR